MPDYTGWLEELLLEPYQNATARLRLPSPALPGPGQYLQIHHADDPDEILPCSLYAAGSPTQTKRSGEALLPVTGSLPAHWAPGDELGLRGPLGTGFRLPRRLKRLALVALSGHPGPLFPLLAEAAERQIQVALVADGEQADLPPAIEVLPLAALAEGLAWAEFLAIEISTNQVEELPERLGLDPFKLPQGQVLVKGAMPCGGLAQCGVCTIPARRGTRLPCQDGPVFPLQDLIL